MTKFNLLSNNILTIGIICVFAFCSTSSVLAEDFSEALQKGYKFYQSGDFEDALVELQTANAQQPKNPQTVRMLADTFRKLHRYPEAEQELQTLLTIEPNNISNVMTLADLYQEESKHQSALGLYQQVLSAQPDNTAALLGHAICLEGTDDLESAAEQYRDVIKKFPNTTYAQAANWRLSRITNALKAEKTANFFPTDSADRHGQRGRWNLTTMPLHVYVDKGEGVAGYRSEMRGLIDRALEEWSSASHGNMSFELDPSDLITESRWNEISAKTQFLQQVINDYDASANDPISAEIHVHWVASLPRALGLTYTHRYAGKNAYLAKAHIWIATDILSNGGKMPAAENVVNGAIFDAQIRMMEEVTIHEFGHALGLIHSYNPNDIMCSGIYSLNSIDRSNSRDLSTGDIQSLRSLYNDFQEHDTPIVAMSKFQQSPAGSAPAPRTAPAAGADNSSGPDNSGLPPFPGEEKPDENKSDSDTGGNGQNPGDNNDTDNNSRDDNDSADAPPPKSVKNDPLRLALFEIDTKHYKQAIATLDKILAVNPKHPQAHYVKAIAYVMLKQYPQAATEYREVIKLAPNTELERRATDGLKKLQF